MVGTDPLQDAPVGLGERLRPDVRNAEIDERSRGEDGRLDVGTDRDDGRDRVADAELAQGQFVRGVGLDDVREDAAHVLDAHRVGVEAEDLVAHVDEGGGERGTESTEADDHDLAVVFDRRAEAGQHRVECLVSQ